MTPAAFYGLLARLAVVYPETGEVAVYLEPRDSIGPTATWLTRLREEVGNGPVVGIDYHLSDFADVQASRGF